MDMNDHRRQLFSAKQEAGRFFDEGETTLINIRPDSGTWSVEECYVHLIRFGTLFLDSIREVIDRPRSELPAGDGDYHHRLHIRLFVRLMEPPYRIRFHAPRLIQPTGNRAPSDIPKAFGNLQDGLLQTVERLRGVQIDKLYIWHPVFPVFRLNLSEALAVTEVHQRRHMWQARRIYRHLSDSLTS